MQWENMGSHKRLTFFRVTEGGAAFNVSHDERRHETYSVWVADRSRASRFVSKEQAEDAMKSVIAGELCAPAFDLHVLDPWEEQLNRRQYTIRKWTREDAEKAMALVLAPNLQNNVSRSHVQAHIEEVASPDYVVIH